jgi:cellulose synthase/poly-beta-1,6-N-acetylglucosamine synthase-like glycosyltransferase
VGKARNVGARVARGELLLFVDADTFLDTHFVEQIWHSFSNPAVVCVSGILRNLEQLKPSDSLFATLHYGFLNMWSSLSARLGFAMFPSVCVAARRSVFLGMGGFVEDMAVGEDITFSRNMNKLGKCQVNPKAVSYTSVRRIMKCGKLEMYSMYFKNYVKIFVLKQKPWVQDFQHVTTS